MNPSDDPDDLAPARGIAVAVLISALFWVPLIWWAVKR